MNIEELKRRAQIRHDRIGRIISSLRASEETDELEEINYGLHNINDLLERLDKGEISLPKDIINIEDFLDQIEADGYEQFMRDYESKKSKLGTGEDENTGGYEYETSSETDDDVTIAFREWLKGIATTKKRK